jgi:hypothetical protein
MDDRCQIPGCRADADLSYLGHGVCTAHWQHFTSDNQPADALRMALGLPVGHEPELDDTPMSTKKKTTEAKPEKTAKAKREPKEKVELRTVAVRLPEADFVKLHKAAGDRQLANFMRTTLLAAAEKALAK